MARLEKIRNEKRQATKEREYDDKVNQSEIKEDFGSRKVYVGFKNKKNKVVINPITHIK